MACTIEDLNPSEVILGCTDPLANNFNPDATVDDGTCDYTGQISGCTDPSAINYDPEALIEDCNCIYDECPPISTITISPEGVVLVVPEEPSPGNDTDINNPIDGEGEVIVATERRILRGNGKGEAKQQVIEIFGPQGSGGSGTGIGTSNIPQPLENLDCCTEEVVGQPVTILDGFCVVVNPTGCPPNLATTVDGELIDGDTGAPVSEECCLSQKDFTYFPNIVTDNRVPGSTGGCFRENPIANEEPCELTIEDIQYLDTGLVVYNPTTPPSGGGSGSSGTGVGTGNVDTGNVDTGTDISQGCFTINVWGPIQALAFNGSENEYLFALRTTNTLAGDLQNGSEIEITGLEPLLNSVNAGGAYYVDLAGVPYIDNYLVDQILTVETVLFDSNTGDYTIVTQLNITYWQGNQTIESSLLSQSIKDSSASVCPVFVDTGDGTGGDTGGTGEETGSSTGGTGEETGGSTGGTGEGTGNSNCPCDCGPVQITSFPRFTFEQPGFNLPTLVNNTPFWNATIGEQIQITAGDGNTYQSDDYILALEDIDPSVFGITSFPSNGGASLGGQPVRLNTCFWNALQQSCFSQFIDTTPRDLQLIGIDWSRTGYGGYGKRLVYLSIKMSASDAQGTILEMDEGDEGNCSIIDTFNANSSGGFCLCEATSGAPVIGGVDEQGQRTTRIALAPGGFTLPGETTSLPSNDVDPCETSPIIVPTEPSDDPENPFTNLTENCCLTLGADLGWEFIEGLCYWNPPAQPISTEFGLSENEIIVDDLECSELIISASFYLERPDDIECEPEDGEDITASIVVYTGDTLDGVANVPTTILSTFNLSNDGYCQWTDIESSIINPLTPFKLKLVLDGVKECCEYDIFVDDIQVICSKQDSITVNNYFNCPGFNLKRVVDNKKSWVQNVEKPVNRIFAPSPDADLPWRYTNYFEQSGVYDNDSRLVLNSKEIDLVFNMRRPIAPCEPGFTYNPEGDNCVRKRIGCPENFPNLSGDSATCYSGTTCDCINIEWQLVQDNFSGSSINTLPATVDNDRNVWLFDVSGQTYSLGFDGDAWLIFNGTEGGGLEYVFPSRTFCPVSTFGDWQPSTPNFPLQALTITQGTCSGGTASATTINEVTDRTPNSCNTDLNIYDLIDYKSNFQNFWVKFVEQFIPATTIFVSGEKWSNRDDEICPTIEECGFDNLFTTSDLGIEETDGGIDEAVENRNTNIVSDVITSDDDVTSNRNGDYGSNNQKGPIILDNFVGAYLEKDESVLEETPLTLKRGELTLLNKGKTEYINKIQYQNYRTLLIK